MNNWKLDNLNNLMGDEEVSKRYSLMPEGEAVEEEPAPSDPEELARPDESEGEEAGGVESSVQETVITESPEEDKPVEEAKTEEAKEIEQEVEEGNSEQEVAAEETKVVTDPKPIEGEPAHPDESEGKETGGAESGEQEDAMKEKEEASETPEPESEMDPQEAAKLTQQTFIVQSTYKDIRKDLPDFRSGDTISVGYRVIEGSRSRIQSFEGVVIKISAGHGLDKTFTVRKISSGVGVERIFPLYSPNIDSIKVLKHGKVRRAKLYYLRSRVGKATRIKERTTQ